MVAGHNMVMCTSESQLETRLVADTGQTHLMEFISSFLSLCTVGEFHLYRILKSEPEHHEKHILFGQLHGSWLSYTVPNAKSLGSGAVLTFTLIFFQKKKSNNRSGGGITKKTNKKTTMFLHFNKLQTLLHWHQRLRLNSKNKNKPKKTTHAVKWLIFLFFFSI